MQKKWWHGKVAYQIYPKSFLDTTGNGTGDLKGIIKKLDYLKELGIDIIWLSPCYQSPLADQGYDISDYYSIAEEFGTMEEFDELLAEAKKRNMYIVMDLVVNHCSDQHEWFQKAIADPDGEYGDYFYFREGKDGKAPANYRSYFGGNAWDPVPGSDKYYLHMFAKEQPDLNWENPVVRKKIYEMINWWLDKGLAGFRIDAIINIKKETSFPTYATEDADGLVSCVTIVEDAPGIGAFLQEMNHETFEKYDAFTVAEVFNMKEEELVEFVGEEGHFSTMFDFSAHELTFGEYGWYDSKEIDFDAWRKTIIESQKKMEKIGFLANILENHDEPRGASRYLPKYAQNEAGKKMLGTTSVLLRGIPFIYQGQEIGMVNCERKDISEFDDISTKDQYQVALDAGCTVEKALECCNAISRDNARTPMHWTAGENAGFTEGTPWLALNDNYTEINVAEQESREDSVLAYYRKLLALRKCDEYRMTFTYGSFEPAYEEKEKVMAYYRVQEENGQKILVAGNYGTESCVLPVDMPVKKVMLSNMGKEESVLKELEEKQQMTLESCESVVILF